LNLLHAFLLGLIQGLTEFIPVSSTAHLLVAQKLLGLPAGDLMFGFLVIIQLGTVLSLIVLFWNELLTIAGSVLGSLRTMATKPRDTWNLTPDALLGWHIILATIPAALIGYLLRDAVEALFQQPLIEASVRLLSAAILLALAEWLGRRTRGLDSMTWLDALIIGFFQVIAVFPGASRSGTTISGGMLRGLDRPAAARFAFLMSIPIMLGAGAFQVLDVIHLPGLVELLPAIALGFITAAVAGWFSVRWLLGYLNRNSLYVFAAYCGLAGAACLIFSILQWTG
jgi:undecaprenyl-diphosphatase